MLQQTPQFLRIPNEAYQLGELYHLGTPLTVYKVVYTRSDMGFFLSQVCMMVLALVVLIGVVLAVFVFHAHNSFTLLLPLILLLNSFNILNISRRKNKTRPLASPFDRNLRVYVYTDGFIRLRNTTPEVVRWDQIERVQYIRSNGGYGRQPSVTVYRNDGKKMGFSSVLPNIDELGATIEGEYYLHRRTG